MPLSSPSDARPAPLSRLRTSGRFFRAGGEKVSLRGVTYGPFPPDEGGRSLPSGEAMARDLDGMVALGANLVRLYELPPEDMVEACRVRGLWLALTLPWTQHVDFLSEKRHLKEARDLLRETVGRFRGDPVIAAYLVGNEIPHEMVRWMGPDRVRHALESLIALGRSTDAGALFSYASYPTTEYLVPRNQDFMAMNVYLEDREALRRYLRRLQVQAGDKPLWIAEFGLDSRAHGEAGQAAAWRWHLEEIAHAGVAGTTVYAWSDRWFRGGAEVTGWDFGLTRRDDSRKPSWAVVAEAWRESGGKAFEASGDGPLVSVIVCTYRGARTLRGCLESLRRLRHGNRELIVVNDGSDPAVSAIVKEFPEVRLIEMPHQGLSAARNVGGEAANGEILAYTDDDCEADEDWLSFLVRAFVEEEADAVGGPNIPPPASGFISACVAAAPGGPAHVLLDDRIAEHVPGCNLAVRKTAFLAVGGFDARFDRAGDDVDFCWRLQEAGFRVGFHPAAMVWHHRRFRLRDYWRQQIGYGEAEARLIPLHPRRFGLVGGARWQGFIYDPAYLRGPDGGALIYQGKWGMAPFQRLYGGGGWGFAYVVSSFHWVSFACLVAACGIVLPPLLAVAALMLAVTVGTALRFGWEVRLPMEHDGLRGRLLVSLLALVQPILRGARRYLGSIRHRRLPRGVPPLPRPFLLPDIRALPGQSWALWQEDGLCREAFLSGARDALRRKGLAVTSGAGWESWDLEISGSIWWTFYLTSATEYHEEEKRLLRLRLAARTTPLTLVWWLLLAVIAGFGWRLGFGDLSLAAWVGGMGGLALWPLAVRSWWMARLRKTAAADHSAS